MEAICVAPVIDIQNTWSKEDRVKITFSVMQNNSNVYGMDPFCWKNAYRSTPQSFSNDPYTYPIEKWLITMVLLHLSIPQIQQYN